MLCLSPCAPHLHVHLHRSPTARPGPAAATCRNARRRIGVTLCLRVPTTPEERRQRRRLANFQDPSAAPSLKPPARLTPAAERRGALREMRRVWWVCGAGYWVQGFRCFPWLALNFHLTRGLGLSPAGLQLVQNAGSIPLVAKPLFGVLSDAVYIGRAHRLPYISLGVMLQLIAWGTLAVTPVTVDAFPTQMACILIGNLGASVTEVDENGDSTRKKRHGKVIKRIANQK